MGSIRSCFDEVYLFSKGVMDFGQLGGLIIVLWVLV
jgi:hypothetical protein